MRALVSSFIMRDYNPNRIALENCIKPLYKYKTLLFLSIPIILRHMLRFQTIIYHFSLFPKEFAIRKSFFFLLCSSHCHEHDRANQNIIFLIILYFLNDHSVFCVFFASVG